METRVATPLLLVRALFAGSFAFFLGAAGHLMANGLLPGRRSSSRSTCSPWSRQRADPGAARVTAADARPHGRRPDVHPPLPHAHRRPRR